MSSACKGQRRGWQREMYGETEAFAPSWTIRHPDALAAGGSFSGYVILRAASYPTSGWDISHGTFQPRCVVVCPNPIVIALHSEETTCLRCLRRNCRREGGRVSARR